jgi:hypothetical protein
MFWFNGQPHWIAESTTGTTRPHDDDNNDDDTTPPVHATKHTLPELWGGGCAAETGCW